MPSASPGGLSPRLAALLAFGAGVLTLFAFAPFGLYPLAVAGPALLLWIWSRSSARQALLAGWLFGVGLLGPGVSWLHISIDQFGNVGTPLAILITLLFVLLLALFYALPGWLARRLLPQAEDRPSFLLLAALLWLLAEWSRGWFLTGFPWLSLGYSQIDSPLAGWGPVIGVHGIGLLLLVSAVSLVLLVTGPWSRRLAAGLLLLSIWLGGYALQQVNWVVPAGPSLRVSIVQGNIAQAEKWKPANLRPTLAMYRRLTLAQREADLVIWPETAVPSFVGRVDASFLRPLQRQLEERDTTLLLGIAEWDRDRGQYYNSMLALGSGGRASYRKRHLVPFGEYMPLKAWLRPLIDWLQIPMSDFAPGDRSRPPLLTLAGYPAGISICYEDAFGDEVAAGLPTAAFLVNASNDAWFGDSLALPQHLQIARMRALESGRFLLRATNTGISAIIDPDGGLAAVAPAFRRTVLDGRVLPLAGRTPYVRIGDWPLLLLALAGSGLLVWSGRRR
ncbi:MAG TPA: apolipoprotein N-acyltransferase [Sedimenticola thiotaurini]|uniref:Apolipoprotein N-acyltransferase n=1 Tax=Sedimenticola thiotaurini TaxID=1543721 RepID=A0A831RJQ8_9GAMM|nr:apolipoprotein N-acyltransferase [Sedimenticola thiotaurini]